MVSEISAYFGFGKPNVSQLIERLAEDGLTERVHSTLDHCVICDVITPQDRVLIEKHLDRSINHIKSWS